MRYRCAEIELGNLYHIVTLDIEYVIENDQSIDELEVTGSAIVKIETYKPNGEKTETPEGEKPLIGDLAFEYNEESIVRECWRDHYRNTV